MVTYSRPHHYNIIVLIRRITENVLSQNVQLVETECAKCRILYKFVKQIFEQYSLAA